MRGVNAYGSVTRRVAQKLAEKLHRLVDAGWFENEGEAVRLAVVEFIRRHQSALVERFQREDIDWALSQADKDTDRHEP